MNFEFLDGVYAHGHCVISTTRHRRPQCTCLSKHFRECLQGSLRFCFTVFLKECGCVVHQEGWTLRATTRIAHIALFRDTCPRQLHVEHLPISFVQSCVAREYLRAACLCHHHQTHARDAADAFRARPKRRGVHVPTPCEILFKDLSLCLLVQSSNDRKGVQERAQYGWWELEYELLTSFQREGLRSSEVRQPVNEVESDVV
mmetsp:Transcript_53151/g.142116  ORF Transcript_53151/g.142116 Transcript_53151/m.142116 type:complete len:202 (+) Transcript_53151:314-919(+)